MAVSPKSIRGLLSEANSRVEEKLTSHPRLVPTSASYFNPGDVIFFNYPVSEGSSAAGGGKRLGLIVSNTKGSGVFLSSKGNLLVSMFLLDASPEITDIIINNLYKQRAKASYLTVQQGLKSILGRDKYRTFKLAKIRNVYTLRLEIN